MRPLRYVLPGVVLSLLAPTAIAASYSFGVAPRQEIPVLARHWLPLFAYIKAHAGVTLKFRTAPDCGVFGERAALGRYDFIYANPYEYTHQDSRVGYRAFAKERHGSIRSLLVVRRDGPIHTVRQLQGATVAFPVPTTFGAAMLPRAMLAAAGIRITPRFVHSHESTYLAVVHGLAAAGGGVMSTFSALKPQLRRQLRVLWRSPGYPPSVFAVHRRVPAAVIGRVRKALVAMAHDPEGRRILARLHFRAIVAADDGDWAGMRRMQLPAGIAGQDH